MRQIIMNVELYKIVLTIVALLAFVVVSLLVEAYRARRLDRVEITCLVCMLVCAMAIGAVFWSIYAGRIA